MRLHILCFGPSGSGKTVFASTALDVEEMRPVLLLDTEDGLLSIRSKVTDARVGKESIEPSDTEKINVLPVSDWEQMQSTIDILYSQENIWRTIILDSLTEANYQDFVHICRSDKTREPDTVQIQDYMKSAIHMRNLIRDLRGLKTHLICTALAQYKEHEKTKKTYIVPSMIGRQMPFDIPALSDINMFLSVNDDGEHEAVFRSTGVIQAKDRTEGGMLGESMTNPTLAKIWSLVNGKEVSKQ